MNGHFLGNVDQDLIGGHFSGITDLKTPSSTTYDTDGCLLTAFFLLSADHLETHEHFNQTIALTTFDLSAVQPQDKRPSSSCIINETGSIETR